MKISIPVIKSVDVLLLGGTVSACRRALELKRQGKTVFAATPFSYFGEDLCAYLDLQSEKSSDFRALFGELSHPSPMSVKHGLDRKFIDAGIDYLFQSHPAALLRDAAGGIAGVVIANRSGFQAVAARCVLDATGHSLAARLAGAETEPFVPGEYPVSLIQIGGCARKEGLRTEELPQTVTDDGKTFSVFRATAMMRINALSASEFDRVTTAMRRLCWTPEVVATADLCRIDCGGKVVAPDPQSGILVPEIFERAGEVLKMRRPGKPCTAGSAVPEKKEYEIVRKDRFFRFRDCGTVEFDLDSLPHSESCDVLVVGGGTGGAPAAIAAARAGAKTVCTETLSCLGGICTAGMIGNYWFGNRVGFTAELDNGAWKMGPEPGYDMQRGQSNTQWKREWLLEQGDDAGAEFRFQTTAVAAAVRDGRVCGAVVAGPFGIGVITAGAVVDATGNADIAAAAGGETAPLVVEEPAVQGAGLAPVRLGSSYENTDYSFVCDSDVMDGTRMFTMSRGKFADWFDGTQILDTRERRRIIGDLVLQPQDFFAHRTYHDTINIAMSNFDTHGFILHPMFMLKATEHQPYYAEVPYRALLPRTLDGVLVTGLGVSAHRDCMPLIRMQPDVQNQGYAAGLAAAMSAKDRLPLRKIDLKALQKELIARGILPESVLTETDAVGEISPEASHYELASIFLAGETARKELHDKFSASPDLHTAHILAFLGDDSGRALLESAVRDAEWDNGWCYTGMGQFGPSISPLDSLIFALDRIGGAPELILEKLRKLSFGQEFSHIRAVCVNLMHHPDPQAEGELVRLLSEEGARGNAVRTLADALNSNRAERNDTSVRNSQLKELYLAKALTVCAPENPLGSGILKEYAESMQGYYVLFADGKLA